MFSSLLRFLVSVNGVMFSVSSCGIIVLKTKGV